MFRERNLKKQRERERECVRVRENWWVLELELNIYTAAKQFSFFIMGE